MPVRFETSTEDPWLNGVLIRPASPLRATSSSRCWAGTRLPIEPASLDRLAARRRAVSAADGRAPRMRGEQRHQHQGEEPHDVEVEPVGDAELQRDQDRGASAATSTSPAPRARTATRTASADRGALDQVLLKPRPPHSPQIENGDRALGLVGDRSRQNARRSALSSTGSMADDDRGGEGDDVGGERRAGAAGVPAPRRNSGAERQRRELGQPGQRGGDPAGRRPSRSRSSASTTQQRDQRVVAVGVSAYSVNG